MSWSSSTLGDLVERDGGLIQTGPFGSQLHQSDYVIEGIPVIMPKDIADGRVDAHSVARVSEETANRLSRHQLQPRVIVLPRRGEITKRALIREDETGWLCGTGCLQIALEGEHLLPEFLYYYMEQQEVGRWLEQHAVGTTMLNLSATIVAGLPLKYPVPIVQQRIADILSAYDNLIENNRRRMELLEEAASQLYREWFVRLQFPGHEHCGNNAGVPDGWERKNLGQMLTLKRGYDLPESRRAEGDIPIVSSSGTTGFHDEKKASAPGIVTGRYGTIGEVFFVQQDYWPLNTALYVSDFKGSPPAFLAHLLKHALSGILSDKAAVPGVNRNVLHRLAVLSPPTLLIDQFAEFAHLTYQQIHTLESTNQKLRSARDLLLPRLMGGEITV
jgi:type I restriction enzyme S subunit